MKAVLMSIQPYWVFLIIAKKMGWNINQEKTIEVRKNYPKDGNWNKIAKIYCSKDKKSFAKIPNEYQPLMERLLGKVIGEFVCNKIEPDDLYSIKMYGDYWKDTTCLSQKELIQYGDYKRLYFWHISNLVIYEKPKELSKFHKPCRDIKNCLNKAFRESGHSLDKCFDCGCEIKRPPQSWCFVEGVN